MYIHESWLLRRRSIYGKMRANATSICRFRTRENPIPPSRSRSNGLQRNPFRFRESIDRGATLYENTSQEGDDEIDIAAARFHRENRRGGGVEGSWKDRACSLKRFHRKSIHLGPRPKSRGNNASIIQLPWNERVAFESQFHRAIPSILHGEQSSAELLASRVSRRKRSSTREHGNTDTG